MLKTQPKFHEFPLEFPSNYNGEKRNIFIGSHIELKNEQFLNYLPNKYIY